jgi:hypothetical protein
MSEIPTPTHGRVHMGIRSLMRGAAVAATVLAASAAAPTAHAAQVAAGGGAAVTTGSSGQHLYTATLTADVTPAGLGLVAVTWNCQATATPTAVSTSISECSVGGRGASPTTLPGAFAATATTSVFPIGSVVDACVAGFASFAETVLGGQFVNGPRSCSSIVLAAF